jgi:HrpA-like RNA helicase
MENKTVNPYTGLNFTPEQKEIVKKLASFGCADPLVLAEFNKHYKKNDVVVFKAGTGTGKGVVIAPHIMNLENLKAGKLIGASRRVVITEPRTTNCRTAIWVGKVYGPKNVNYNYRFNNLTTNETLLNFLTDGLLVNYFYNDPELPEYVTVIIDEVHERNKNIDQILAFCRIFKKKTVILSATIDVGFYVDFFRGGDLTVGSMELPAVPTKPIKDIYLEIEEDFVKQSIGLVNKIILSGEPGDIIVFLSSGNETKKACKELLQLNLGVACYDFNRNSRDEYAEKIQGEFTYKEDLINGKVPSRKVIFSTNVAESGITIGGLRYVIDAGRRYESVFVAEEGLNELKSRFISRSESDQRRGRVGRTAPGTSYRLFSEQDFLTKFLEYKEAEILVEDITGLTLTILGSKFGDGDLQKVKLIYDNMPTPPSDKQQEFAVKRLKALGILTADDRFTKLGREVANAAVGGINESIVLIRALSNKIMHGISKIMALFTLEPSAEKWFKPPRENTPEWPRYKKILEKWSSSRGEIFVLKKIYDGFIKTDAGKRQKWCQENFLDFGKLVNTERQFWKIKGAEKKLVPIYEPEEGQEDELIQKCFEYGYAENIAEREGGLYRVDRPVGFVKVDKPVLLKKLGKKILFVDMVKINGKIAVSTILNLE